MKTLSIYFAAQIAKATVWMVVAGLLASASRVEAQGAISATRALSPITRLNGTNVGERRSRGVDLPPAARPKTPATTPQAAKPTEIVAKIDAGLAASKISVVGRLDGLKGTMYVTNLSQQTMSPTAQFAVCNTKGVRIGTVSQTGASLEPNESEQIVVIATNVSGVDLKLFKLSCSAK